MLLLPVIARGVAAAAAERRRRARPAEALVEPPADENHRVILVGYGRVGTLIGELFDVHKIPFIAIDADINVVASARKEGRPAYFGDASRPEFLRRCGIDTARALVVTLNAPRGTVDVVDAARKLRPDITIIARARDAEHASELYQLGVTDAVPEAIEASLQLSEAALVDLGVPMGWSSPRSTTSATSTASGSSPLARGTAANKRGASRGLAESALQALRRCFSLCVFASYIIAILSQRPKAVTVAMIKPSKPPRKYRLRK